MNAAHWKKDSGSGSRFSRFKFYALTLRRLGDSLGLDNRYRDPNVKPIMTYDSSTLIKGLSSSGPVLTNATGLSKAGYILCEADNGKTYLLVPLTY